MNGPHLVELEYVHGPKDGESLAVSAAALGYYREVTIAVTVRDNALLAVPNELLPESIYVKRLHGYRLFFRDGAYELHHRGEVPA